MNAELDETNLAAYKLTKPNKSQVYKLNISPTYKLNTSPLSLIAFAVHYLVFGNGFAVYGAPSGKDISQYEGDK